MHRPPPWMPDFVLDDFIKPGYREEREDDRGGGAPVAGRLRRRRKNMFPSDALPGRVRGRLKRPERRQHELSFGRYRRRRWWLISEGKRKGMVREWICLVEAKVLARGIGRQCSDEGDRPMAGIWKREKREAQRALRSGNERSSSSFIGGERR
uniref:Uncharacterized protein n=1 Tax=Oryza rufipogon TaxID=4529 RepID=A0A0E0QHX3_ORYRU